MCTTDYFLLIAFLVILWFVFKGREMFTVGDPAMIVSDIATNVANNGDYTAYKLYGRVPLTPYLYLRCVDLYKQKRLSEDVIRSMLFSSMA
jgi:hypothetical protein